MANYVFSDASTHVQQTALRHTVSLATGPQPDSAASQSLLVNQHQLTSSAHTGYHRVNLRLNYRPDSANVIQFLPGMSLSSLKTASTGFTQTQLGQQHLNQNGNTSSTTGTTLSGSTMILWMHRFARAGRTFSLEFKTAINHQDNDGINESRNTFYGQSGKQDSLQTSILNQHTTQLTHSLNKEWNLIYTERISAQTTLGFHIQLATNHGTSERSVMDANPRTGAYDQPNALLSSQYQSNLMTNRVGTSWQVRQPGYSYTLGLDLQQTNLNAATQTGGPLLDRHYLNVLPSLIIQPKLAPNHYLQVQYQNQIRAPSVGQLQPVANVTNPLFIQ